jgi:hypothetical protein
MTIQLPAVRVADITERLYPAPNVNESAIGTGTQRFVRAGRRWEFVVTLTHLRHSDWQDWADLERDDDDFLLPINQHEIDVGSPGTPLVAGAGQSGTTLNVDGLTPGYVAQKAQWFSIVTGGRRYCYKINAAVTASGAGEATLSNRPMLRVTPNNNDVVELAQPYLQGVIVEFPGFRHLRKHKAPLSFTIRERS